MTTASDARARLAARMNESRAQQQMSWEQAADRAGISTSLLRAIRSNKLSLTLDSKIAVERGFSWQPGDVDRILSDPDYVPGVQVTTPRGGTDVKSLMAEVREGDTGAALELLVTLKAVSDEAFWEGFQFISDARAALRMRRSLDVG